MTARSAMGTGGTLVIVDFSRQGNSERFRREGWSGQEDDRVWAVGPRAVLNVPMWAAGRSVIVEAELGPGHLPPDISGQLVRVTVDASAIGWVRLEARSMIRCEIEATLTREDGALEVAFEFPGYFRPGSLRGADDSRPLAAWFSFVRLYTTDMFRPGPHFPSSGPEIPVIDLLPPVVPIPDHGPTTPRTFTFDPAGDGIPTLRGGWAHGSDDAALLMAASGQIVLPVSPAPGPRVLRLDVSPPIEPEPRQPCDVTVTLDNIVIGQFSLVTPTIWMLPLPLELTAGRGSLSLKFLCRRAVSAAISPSLGLTRMSIIPLPVSLYTPDFVLMARDEQIVRGAVSDRFQNEDAAMLPEAIEAVLGRTVAALARDFESLGLNRDFGAAQREMGHDALNFFRCCEATLTGLLRGLADDLRCASDAGSIAVEPDPGHVDGRAVSLSPYELRWPLSAGDANVDPGVFDLAARFGYLRRKFQEGFAAGRKIYVFSQGQPIPAGAAIALLLELNRRGRATLLCVEPASNGRRSGEVSRIMPGLLWGHVDAADPAAWTRLIANAGWLRREHTADLGF